MQETLHLFKLGMVLTLLLSAPVMLACVVVGVLLSLIQAAFQLQDQTLPIVVKIVVAAVMLFACWNWTAGQVLQMTQWVFERIENVR